MIVRILLLFLFALDLFSADSEGDYHLHLSGSVSREFLHTLARSDNRDDLCEKLHDKNLSIGLFSVAHQLLNSNERIYLATLDVIEKSKAPYLEIRTGLRDFNGGNNYQGYLDSFLQALRDAKKPVKGFLSIDRFKHEQNYIDFVVNAARENSDVILGIDISGFMPGAQRILVKELLAQTIEKILEAGLIVTIHLGETYTPEEELDTDTVFTTLCRLLKNYPLYHQQIRLGHVIFLNEAQREILWQMKFTCEFCPSSFRYLTRGISYDVRNHPILLACKNGAKILLGTDDTLVFQTSYLREQHEFEQILAGCGHQEP